MSLELDSFEQGFDAGRKSAAADVAKQVSAEVDRLVFLELDRFRSAGREVGKTLGRLEERKRIIAILNEVACEGGDIELALAIIERKLDA